MQDAIKFGKMLPNVKTIPGKWRRRLAPLCLCFIFVFGLYWQVCELTDFVSCPLRMHEQLILYPVSLNISAGARANQFCVLSPQLRELTNLFPVLQVHELTNFVCCPCRCVT